MRNEKVKHYVEDRDLPVELLVDDSREVLKAYGAWHDTGGPAGVITRPSLFVIDRTGLIRYAFVAQAQHEFPAVDEILGELGRIGTR